MSSDRRPQTSLARGVYGLALTISVAGIVLAGLVPRPDTDEVRDLRFAAWLFIMGLLLVFIILAGKAITGYWRGALIDDRNQVSLSRFQLAVWTSLILSAYLEAALSNIRLFPREDPISIAMPAEIWTLLGIATTSLVASPLILKTKKDRIPAADDVARVTDAGMAVEGQVVIKPAGTASWSDMLTGDETADESKLDLGKVQMFFFTLVLVLAYAVSLGSTFLHESAKIDEFPAFDAGMVALLGISHAGYLANKAVPRSDPSSTQKRLTTS